MMYVAVTRAKKSVMLSFSEMRRVWGKTENTSPSRFLKEIDREWLDANFEIEELSGRNRWERALGDDEDDDIRPRKFESLKSRYGGGDKFPRRDTQSGPRQQPRPEIIATPKPIDPRQAGMKSVGVRPSESDGSSTLGECPYSVGERVSHPKFGIGTVERIEPLATDHKVVVAFDSYGTKTLLAKFAKFTKL